MVGGTCCTAQGDDPVRQVHRAVRREQLLRHAGVQGAGAMSVECSQLWSAR